jgi:hypothetical protein
VARWKYVLGVAADYVSVLGLDVTGAGGSLQASSRVLLSQGRQLVVRVWPRTEGAQTVLYNARAAAGAPAPIILFADPSGRWVITWPLVNLNADPMKARIGWIRDGRLVPMPGATMGIRARSLG